MMAGPRGMDDPFDDQDVFLDVGLFDDYKLFIDALVKKFTEHPEHNANKGQYGWITDNNILLPERMTEEPKRWMYVHLTAKDNDGETKKIRLAIRDDDVYLVGFKNERREKWNELGTRKDAPLLPRSAFIGCNVMYGSLVGGRENLVNLKVGMECAREAVFKLSSYDHRVGPADKETKIGLACLVVMICESARMLPLYDTVKTGWSAEPRRVVGTEEKYVDNWEKLSNAVMGRGKFPEVLRQFGVLNRNSALPVVRLLLNSPSEGSGGGGGGGGGDGDGRDSGRRGDRPRKNEKHKQTPQEKQKQQAKEKQVRKENKKPGAGGSGRNKRSHDDPNQKRHDEEGPPLKPTEQVPSQQQDDQEPPPMPAEQSPPQPQPHHHHRCLPLHEEEEEDDDGEEEEEEEDDEEEDGEEEDGDEEDDDDDDDDDCADPGQFLLEVLAIHANTRVVCTIAVFDRKRGQIIYSDDGQGDAPNKDSQDNLLLTGPYKAISAGGRVSVKFTDQSDNIGRVMLWDSYNNSDDDTYDTVLTKDITLGAVTFTVKYAVLSNAVEADVQVEMKLENGGTTAGVYGEIMARVPCLGDTSVMLFCRTREQALEALTSSDGTTIPVPLPRSVLVVPFGIKVKLQLKLYPIYRPNNENIVAIDECVDLSLDERPRKIESQGMVVQVKITSPSEEVDTATSDINVLPEQVDTATPTESHPAPAPATTAHRNLDRMTAGPIGMDDQDVFLDVGLFEDYRRFIDNLVKKLTKQPEHDANKDQYKWITDANILLPEQMAEEPKRWMYVHLTAKDNDGETKKITLAIRDDNVYLVGFKNYRTEKWNELGTTGKDARRLPRSAFIGCNVMYGSLVGGRGNLANLKVGMECAREAVCKLSSYDHREGPADQETKRHLACLVVMICESARMFLLNGWGCRRTAIDEEQVKYVDNWEKLSKAAMGWGEFPEVLREFGVVDRVSALDKVRLLLNSPPKGSGRGRGPGQFLLEVLAIHAKTRVVGTIAVFDGKRGQIIYRDDGEGDAPNKLDSQDNLLLTGPYKAISAGGRVSVKFTHQSSNIGRVMLWDSYNNSDNNECDTVLTKCIAVGTVTIMVTYAVLSNAVEADVQVEMKLEKGGTTAGVYGEIMARVQAPCLGDKSVMLFCRTREQALEALTSSDGTAIPVPLPRSVLVVPFDFQVMLQLKLRAACLPNNENIVAIDGCVHLSRNERSREIESHGVVLRVKITSPDIIDAPSPSKEVDTAMSDVNVLPEQVDTATPTESHPAPVPATTAHRNLHTICPWSPSAAMERRHRDDAGIRGERRRRQGIWVRAGCWFRIYPWSPSAAMERRYRDDAGIRGERRWRRQRILVRAGCGFGMPGHEGKDGPPVVVVALTLDLDDGDYARCIQELREKLTNHQNHGPRITGFSDWIKYHLLPMQQPKQPARWIHIKLMARSKMNEKRRHTITLLIRDDNVYLVGFMNQNEDLFELGVEGRNEHLIRESTFLGCDVSYTGLVGGSKNLEGLEVGKSSAAQAVHRLSVYKHVGPADAATRQDLALLCVMFCEAARMIPHYDTVYKGWNVGSKIKEQHVEYTRTWTNKSLDQPLLRRSSVLHLQLNSWLPRQLWLTRLFRLTRGRPLVEVLSVHAEDGVVGTITVFDGKRAQIIYKHCNGYLSRRPIEDLKELALTGPYRAISADGSFAIQVDGVPETDASGESSKVSGDMFWDCYADVAVYDEVLTHKIIIGTGRIVVVAYAVFSDAAEATAQVNLLLPAGINHVYGQITARHPLLYKEIVLFSREPEEKVELVPSSAGSIVPLPLARSVIAVPHFAFWLSISVDLHVVSANNESAKIHLKGYKSFEFDEDTGTIYSTYPDDIFLRGDWTRPDPVKRIGEHPEKGTASYSSDLQDTHGVSTPGSLQGAEQTSIQKGMVQVVITVPGLHVSPDFY